MAGDKAMDARIVYRVVRIEGDYAVLAAEDGTQNRLARALLPEETDEGDTLVYQNLTYELLK